MCCFKRRKRGQNPLLNVILPTALTFITRTGNVAASSAMSTFINDARKHTVASPTAKEADESLLDLFSSGNSKHTNTQARVHNNDNNSSSSSSSNISNSATATYAYSAHTQALIRPQQLLDHSTKALTRIYMTRTHKHASTHTRAHHSGTQHSLNTDSAHMQARIRAHHSSGPTQHNLLPLAFLPRGVCPERSHSILCAVRVCVCVCACVCV